MQMCLISLNASLNHISSYSIVVIFRNVQGKHFVHTRSLYRSSSQVKGFLNYFMHIVTIWNNYECPIYSFSYGLFPTESNVFLFCQVLSVGRLYPPNITFQYTVQRGTQYRWELRDKWTACDRVCNGESCHGQEKCRKFDSRCGLRLYAELTMLLHRIPIKCSCTKCFSSFTIKFQ